MQAVTTSMCLIERAWYDSLQFSQPLLHARNLSLRPLRYRLMRDATGRPLLDVNGNVTITEKREKGVDVLCALAVVREADPETSGGTVGGPGIVGSDALLTFGTRGKR